MSIDNDKPMAESVPGIIRILTIQAITDSLMSGKVTESLYKYEHEAEANLKQLILSALEKGRTNTWAREEWFSGYEAATKALTALFEGEQSK